MRLVTLLVEERFNEITLTRIDPATGVVDEGAFVTILTYDPPSDLAKLFMSDPEGSDAS